MFKYKQIHKPDTINQTHLYIIQKTDCKQKKQHNLQFITSSL